MADPVLAVMVCRMLLLLHPENSQLQDQLNQVYEEYFVQRGITAGDNYLRSIGLWGQKKFVEAVNALQKSEPADDAERLRTSGIENFLVIDSQFQLEQVEVEKKMARFETRKQPEVVSRQKQYLPLASSSSGYELQRVVTKLKKAPLVTLALKQEQ